MAKIKLGLHGVAWDICMEKLDAAEAENRFRKGHKGHKIFASKKFENQLENLSRIHIILMLFTHL